MSNFATVSVSPSFLLSTEERADYLNLYSDYHKEAYGFRPRFRVDGLSDAKLVNDYEEFSNVCLENDIAKDKALVRDLKAWDKLVSKTINLGAGDRTTALKWLLGGWGVGFSHMQDLEHFVWKMGILFSDEGKSLVKELKPLVEWS